ncbi:hypothetical protein ACXC9Q_41220 [Kribbella sp. CWNU-51]
MDEQFDAAHAGGPFGVGHPVRMETAVGRLRRAYDGRLEATARLEEFQNLGIGGVLDRVREEAHVVRGSAAGELHRVGQLAMRDVFSGETARPVERTGWCLPVPTSPGDERGDHAVDCPIQIVGRLH